MTGLMDGVPGHDISVTGNGPFGRAWVDCWTCGYTLTCASKHAANRAALRHHHETSPSGCNCPSEVVTSDAHPDPGPGSPAPVADHASTA
jgi:hypothetical protein